MPAHKSIFFVRCTNPNCQLRFPLDLMQFKGEFCPRCGAALLTDCAAARQTDPSTVNPQARFHIAAVLDNIRSSHNVGAMLRTADGAGFQKVYLGGITPTPQTNPALTKTALGAEYHIDWEYNPNVPDLLNKLKEEGFFLIALETAPNALNLFDYRLPATTGRNIALLVGSEPAGIDPKVLDLADQILYLPMIGHKNSLNVSVAFGIAAYFLQFACGYQNTP